jgi:formate hydrogenlyase subunit 3/multisubunit Na+/H+ antiporter MnhD subunit
MSFDVLMVLIGWLAALAIFFSFIILLRYLHHRETMALISHGINPESLHRQRRSRGMLRAGLIITMVGLALTIGLYPVGFFLPPTFATPFHLGPWLLPGLIPLGVGIALIGSYYLEQNAQISSEDVHDNVIPIQEHQDKKQKEKY